MKYYKNLIQRKKYRPLITGLAIILLSVFVCYISYFDVSTNSIQLNNNYIFFDFITGILSSTNLGMIILGVIIMYFGLVIPTWSPYSQDDSEYILKSVKNYIYIKYKKYEFLVKKETFQPSDLFFKDMNNKFVSLSKGYRIYNYVVSKSKNLIENPLDDETTITRFDVISKFNGVKKATLEEKKQFLNSHKINNKNKIPFLIISIILGLVVLFNIIGILGGLMTNEFKIKETITIILTTIIILLLQKTSIKAMKKNKVLYSKIINNDLYIVNCMIYDKKNMDTDDGHVYYIKITDGNYVVDEWIETSKENYEQKNIQFYVLAQYENEIFMI